VVKVMMNQNKNESIQCSIYNNVPSVETAVKIAQVLGVSVEYLVNGTETSKSPSQKETEQNQLRLYRKYHNLIEKMERFSEDKQTVVNNLVNDLEKL
jgi:transcriptional regulator with XRE-family HTH domain